jgi:hypothetical protein
LRTGALLLAALLAFSAAPDAFARARSRTRDETAEETSKAHRRGHHDRIHRDPAQRREFMRENPCPGGFDRGSTKRCRGWVVDHVKPLKRGGADRPWNMQWQTRAEAKAKDRWE